MTGAIGHLKQLGENATERPWGADSIGYSRDDTRVHVTSGGWDLAYIVPDAPPEIRDSSESQRIADAVFIATARNVWPYIVDIIEIAAEIVGPDGRMPSHKLSTEFHEHLVDRLQGALDVLNAVRS